jgi:P4 family phage/plasmid primase-like protien
MGMIDQLAGIKAPKTGQNPFALPLKDRAALELNDRGNAARILATYGDSLLYVSGRGWGVWDGNRFSFQSGGLKAAEVAARLPDLIGQEIEEIKAMEFDEFTLTRTMEREHNKRNGQRFKNMDEVATHIRAQKIAGLYAHQIKCGNVDKQKKAMVACEWQVRAEIMDLDSDPWVLVVQNGVLDLRAVRDTPPLTGDTEPTAADLAKWRAGWLGPADPSPRPTKCAGTPFIPGAICPEWESFIALILPDLDVRRCLQRAFGALLLGVNVGNAALLLRGGGGNGKSTLMSIIGEVLGNRDGYAATAKVEMFLQTQNQSAGQATPEEVDLPGARAILASEPAVTDVFSGKKIKGLTGGDLRAARALGQPQFTYRPTGIPVIQFNRTPKIKDEDAGLRRRLVFIPLEVNLHELPPDQRRSPIEAERALKEELPGILNWMLDGFRDFHARVDAGQGVPLGIDPPAAMVALKDRIMEAADPVGTFLKECAEIDPSGRTRTAEFFRGFKSWARDTGARVFSDAALRDNLTEKGFAKVKSNGNMCFSGFRWKEDDLVKGYVDDLGPVSGHGGYSEGDFR